MVGIEFSPNGGVLKSGQYISLADDDAITFGKYLGEFLNSPTSSDVHYSLIISWFSDEIDDFLEKNGLEPNRKNISSVVEYISKKAEFEGRLWTDKKLIAFWKFPKTRAILQSMIEDIEDYIGIDLSEYKIVDRDGDLIPFMNYANMNVGVDIKTEKNRVPHLMGAEEKREWLMKHGSKSGSEKAWDVARESGFNTSAEYRYWNEKNWSRKMLDETIRRIVKNVLRQCL